MFFKCYPWKFQGLLTAFHTTAGVFGRCLLVNKIQISCVTVTYFVIHDLKSFSVISFAQTVVKAVSFSTHSILEVMILNRFSTQPDISDRTQGSSDNCRKQCQKKILMKYASCARLTFLAKVCYMWHLRNYLLLVILHHLFVWWIIPIHV